MSEKTYAVRRTRKQLDELLHYGHWIPVNRGFTQRFVAVNYPDWTWNELMAVFSNAGIMRGSGMGGLRCDRRVESVEFNGPDDFRVHWAIPAAETDHPSGWEHVGPFRPGTVKAATPGPQMIHTDAEGWGPVVFGSDKSAEDEPHFDSETIVICPACGDRSAEAIFAEDYFALAREGRHDEALDIASLVTCGACGYRAKESDPEMLTALTCRTCGERSPESTKLGPSMDWRKCHECTIDVVRLTTIWEPGREPRTVPAESAGARADDASRPEVVDVIPWDVRHEHRYAYPLLMLRLEARRRAGETLRDDDERRLSTWLAELHSMNAVVEYVRDSPDGFSLVPRTADDDELIRRPAG